MSKTQRRSLARCRRTQCGFIVGIPVLVACDTSARLRNAEFVQFNGTIPLSFILVETASRAVVTQAVVKSWIFKDKPFTLT
jgi:hypothetical protein